LQNGRCRIEPAITYRRSGGQNPSHAMSDTLKRLANVIESRKPANGGDPDKSYVARLFSKGDDAILKKIGEEATETVMAAKDVRAGGDKSKVLYECADLWFHSMIMLAQFDLTPQDVLNELARREGISGIEEKANRKLVERERNGD
jgi:phosphoribosyl-ATP pyrophosphohydrolase